MVDKQITVRIDVDILAKLQKACDRDREPYAPTKTAVVERGIILALRELERKRK